MSLLSFKIIIYKLLVRKFIDLYFLASATGALCCSFGDVLFSWFFLYLKVLYCHLHIWRSSSLLQSLLTVSGEKDLHQSAQLEILGPLKLFLGYICPTFFVLFLREKSQNIFAFSQSCKVRMGAKSLFFPGQCPEMFKVVFFLSILQSWAAASICVLSMGMCVCRWHGLCVPFGGVCAHCLWRLAYLVTGTYWSAAGMHWSVGGSWRWGVLWGSWVGLVLESASQAVASVSGFWDPCSSCLEPLSICSSSIFCQTIQPCWSCPWYEWGEGEVDNLPQAEKPYTHSALTFSRGGNCWLRESFWALSCATLREGWHR